MDNKLIRFYNQNRFLFWIVVLTIVGIIALIHAINIQMEKRYAKLNEQANNNIIVQNSSIDENYTVLTGKKLNTVTTAIIKNFINYCNEGEIEKAYQLLSNDCKEILYPNLDEFKNKYVDKIFNTKKLFACQAMVADEGYYTYQINFTEDILATRRN